MNCNGHEGTPMKEFRHKVAVITGAASGVDVG
jgi:hypothetical protein